MDWTATDFFRPFVNAWIGKLETAYRSEARTHWREVANECKIFYARSCASLWNSRYAAKFLNNVIERPRFPISINKAFELVAVVGPNILWQVPYRKVAPKRRLGVSEQTLQTLMQDPQMGQILPQLLQADEVELADAKTVASLLETWLNYTAREMPDGGMTEHAQLMAVDAMLTGRGVRFLRTHHYPNGRYKITGSFRENPMDVIFDPDALRPQDAKWVALRHRDRYWEVERRFPQAGSLKDKGTLESLSHFGESAFGTEESTSMPTARTDADGNKDVIIWYEIWSKEGPGVRSIPHIEEGLREKMTQVLGDYCYLCVVPNVPYPLNCSADQLRAGMTDDQVRQAFDWPVPYWADNKWPCECHDEETEVLTKDDGWKLFKELDGTEQLATVNLASDKLEFQTPSRIVRKPHYGDMLRFSGRQKLDALVTPLHRMVVYPAHSDVPAIKTAHNLHPSDQLKLTAGNWNGVAPTLPDFLSGVDVLAFTEWLGFYIAEGSCSTKRNGKRKNLSWQVTISQRKEDGKRYYLNLCKRLPFHVQPYRSKPGSFVTSSKDLWQYLHPLGNSHTKRVPQWVKDSPQDVIKAFLVGYIAGDGHVARSGKQISSCTASKGLADDIQELWFKVGKNARISIREPIETVITADDGTTHVAHGGQLYVVTVRNRTKASLRNTALKTMLVSREDGDGKTVYCATVPNGTLVTRRNGQILVSGNCCDIYVNPDSQYPVAPLEPGMGWLKFMNLMMPWVCEEIWSGSRTFWAVLGSQMEEYEKYINTGKSQCIIPVNPSVDDIRKAIQILSQPPVNIDVWKILETASEYFERATGLSAFMYGMKGAESNDRSAEETAARAKAAGVRPQFMQRRIAETEARLGASEALLARWEITGDDVMGLGGQTMRYLWEQKVSTGDVAQVVRELAYTIDANSMQRPDRESERVLVAQAMQILGPNYMQYAMASGDFKGWNHLMKLWGETNLLDEDKLEGLYIEPPPPDPAVQQAQQQQMEMEQAKIQAELQGKQMDVQAKVVDVQAKQQIAQMDLQSKQQMAEIDAQAKVADVLIDQQKARMEFERDQRKAEMDLVQQGNALQMAARKQTLDEVAQQTSLATKLQGEQAMGAIKIDLAKKTAAEKAKEAKKRAMQKPKPTGGKK